MQTATFKYEDKLELMSLEENGEISFKTGENNHNFIVSKCPRSAQKYVSGKYFK